uniref:Uncharacterized protein n=1 Tax=Sinocyclocheilus anshuiensis TaxID=1608454 RepID=A0A671KK32_9TELE
MRIDLDGCQCLNLSQDPCSNLQDSRKELNMYSVLLQQIVLRVLNMNIELQQSTLEALENQVQTLNQLLQWILSVCTKDIYK